MLNIVTNRYCSIIIACALSCIPLVTAAEGEAVSLNRIVAVVNNDVVTQTELAAKIDTVTQQIRQRGMPLPPKQVLTDQVLERVVVDRLQLQLAESTGIRIDDDTLNRAIRRIAKDNDLSLSEFRGVLEQDGFNFASFREDIRNEMIIRRLHERQIHQRIVVTEQDITQFILSQAQETGSDLEYRLAHILVALPEAASPTQVQNAREKIGDIASELADGAEFSELAISYSDGQQALDGGDLGWRKTGELPTLFANIIPRMTVNDVSEVIRGPNGFHLVKLLELRGEERHLSSQTRARHILLRSNELVSEDEAVKQLISLKTRIEQGEDFATLAKEYSDDKGTAIKGGEIGWLKKGDTVPRFEAAMKALKTGEISDPFQSSFGWHIVQVIERRDYDNTQELKRLQAQQAIRNRMIEEETETWLRRLRDEAYIEYRLNENS